MNRDLLWQLRLFSRPTAFAFAAALYATVFWCDVGVDVGNAVTVQRREVAVKESTPRLKAFMRKKLLASQQVVEGLATENRDLITQGATTMIEMSKESIWETHAGAVYTQDTADFVRTAERIVKMSKTKDVEGAALAYAPLTLQCVNCHRHVRSEKIVQLPAKSLGLARLEFRATQ